MIILYTVRKAEGYVGEMCYRLRLRMSEHRNAFIKPDIIVILFTPFSTYIDKILFSLDRIAFSS